MDVEPFDRRIAQRAAYAVYLVAINALPDITLDGEAGEMDIRAATVGNVLAVVTDAGVHRAIGQRSTQGHLVSLDDRVPVTGTFDRDVVNENMAVHLIRAWRQVDHAVPGLRGCDRCVKRVRRIALPARIGTELLHVHGRLVGVLRGANQLGVKQVNYCPGGIARGRSGEADLVARLVGVTEQQTLFVVEVVRSERFGDDRRRGRGRRYAGTLGNILIGKQQAGVRIIGERVLVIEP